MNQAQKFDAPKKITSTKRPHGLQRIFIWEKIFFKWKYESKESREKRQN